MLRLLMPIACLCLWVITPALADSPENARPPASENDLKAWLGNMVWRHKFSVDEVSAATGLSSEAVAEALQKFDIQADNAPAAETNDRLPVLPYPGGRHPRIGFLDGAVDPQRETKVSVFTPWQPEDKSQASYVVADIPEAIWSNLGLTYLAHTHVPTVWSKQGIALPRQEWEQLPNGVLRMKRVLPNGIEFEAVIEPQKDHVTMALTLKNGTSEMLSDLRVQNCVMLKGAPGFTEQSNDNKVMQAPYSASHDTSGKRWVITAWSPNHRAWGNPPCPCLHSDPKFPDCPPGETRTVRGWLSFYEGDDVKQEFARIDSLKWADAAHAVACFDILLQLGESHECSVAGPRLARRSRLRRQDVALRRLVWFVRSRPARCVVIHGWQGLAEGHQRRPLETQRPFDVGHLQGQDVVHGGVVQWAVARSLGQQRNLVIDRRSEVGGSHAACGMDATDCIRAGRLQRQDVAARRD